MASELELAAARRLLAAAGSLVVLTGAGISAESGIPTFRGPGGLWRNFRPEALATPEAFARDPLTVWEWYLWRRGLIDAAEPKVVAMDFSAVPDIEYSALKMLIEGEERARERGMLLWLVQGRGRPLSALEFNQP